MNEKKILVVDDDRLVLKALQTRLVEAGFTVKTAENGKKALDILKQEPFDFVILDWVMPKINGFEVLREARLLKINTPMIMLSSYGQEEQEKGAKELGITDIFDKAKTPLPELIEYVKNFLSKQSNISGSKSSNTKVEESSN